MPLFSKTSAMQMRRFLAFIGVVVLAVASMAGCSSDDSSSTAVVADDLVGETDTEPDTEPTETDDTTEPTETDDGVELAELAVTDRGPYPVGVTTVTVTDESRQRPLTVEVWFPLTEGTTGDPATYSFITGDYYPSPNALAAEPASIATDQLFPLAIYTHGSGGLRFIDSDFTEMLASHGYVVAAADHTGNTAVELVFNMETDTERILLDRPLDVRAVIDAMLDAGNPDTVEFAKAINPDHVAVAGHSLGGTTAFEVIAGYENDYGASPADERVGAIITFAPAVGNGGPESLVTDEMLASTTVPVLVVAGTDDKTTPVDPNVETIWDHSAATPLYRVELSAAEHQSFTDMCAYQAWIPSLPAANPLLVQTVEESAVAGCSADDMPIDRAKGLTNTFAVAFLNSVFRGLAMPLPETHTIPDDVVFLAR